VLVELETDKVTLEVPAPAAGVLGEILAPEGATVAPGAVLGSIGEGGGGAAAPKADEAAAEQPAPEKSTASSGDAPKPAPAAQRLIREQNLDSSAIQGTGRRGQILKEDVLARATAQEPVEPAEPAVAARAPSRAEDAPREERVRMSRLRQTIARRLKDAQNTAAMLTTFNEVDMSAVMELRTRYKDLFQQ